MQTGARHIDVPQHADARGLLITFEQGRPLPFTPVRSFVISQVPDGARRAGHRIRCDEFLWMISGACVAGVGPSDAADQVFDLEVGGPGLYVPKGFWLDLYRFTSGSALLCLADAEYVARGSDE